MTDITDNISTIQVSPSCSLVGANYPGVIAIELKIGKNVLSTEQVAWLRRAKVRGYPTAVARTLAGFKTIVLKFVDGVGTGSAADPFIF